MWFERWRHVLPLKLRSLFRRDAVERELDDELQYHIERQIDALVAGGMTADAARTAALRAIGGVEVRKEECRDTRGFSLIDMTVRDLRHALRVLRRSPLFTAIAIGSLAVGIGANAALFQLIDLIQLRSVPVASPHELAEIKVKGSRAFGISDGFNSEITYPLWEQIRDHQQAFSGVFAWGVFRPFVGRGAEAQRAIALWASGSLFRVLGIAPERGRLLVDSDDRRGCGAGAVVISHAFWQRDFGGKDSVVGARLQILDQTFTVVGVTPAGFTGLEVGRSFDVVIPVCSAALWGDALDQRHYWWLTVMGRLKPSWTIAAADAQLRGLSPGFFEATVPSGYSAESTKRYLGFVLGAVPASRGVSGLREDYGRSLWLLLVMTALVLLITCGNLATLLLARSRARAREIMVRIAIGATTRRVLWQLLIESLLIGFAGAALSVPVALLSSRALVAFLSPDWNPIHLNLALNWRVVTFAGSVALVTSILFGLLPSVRLSLVSPVSVLRRAGRGLTLDRTRALFQRGLVVTQIAMSLVLVVSAVLFVRSFRNLIDVKIGFEPDNLLAVSFADLAASGLSLERRMVFQQALADAIRMTPGVVAAASSTHTPLNGASWSQGFRFTSVAIDARTGSKFSYVDPDYFETMKIPLVAGRLLASSDTTVRQRVIVVNEAFVRTQLQGRSPLGATLRTFAEPGYPATVYEIVGVVRDTMYASLRGGMPAIAFVPMAQHPNPRAWTNVLVRTDGSIGVADGIRRSVARLSPGIVVQVGEIKRQIRELSLAERLMAWLAGAFGALATTLAGIGLYGLVAYLAAARRHEIGIRLSLGSTRAQVIGLMMRDTARLVVGGLAVGVPLSFLAMRSVNALLFGPAPTALTPAAAAVVLAGVTAVSAGIPAWRASRLDPIATLHME
ncbi:MAG TPA: ABC transporter permease [Vicinamibacterales bacterium]|nr:ABC transporter permease [Vicinamibacterales bacterium]